jgi:hypothetical protein
MRRNTEDKTIERSFQQKWKFLISEYLLTKQKKHPKFKFAADFYKAHGINRQTFNKYYNRFLNSGLSQDLLPRKRGPRWKSRRADAEVEAAVCQERQKGLNRYEIFTVLKPVLSDKTPSPSGIYNIIKRNNLNILRPKMKEEKRKIIKEKAGELGHIDCHYLSKDLIVNDNNRYYLVCLIDSYSRIAWVELVKDIKSLTVMFALMRNFQTLMSDYNIRFEEVITDNGAEFKGKENKENHPVERLLVEMGIKHRYTKPYRPQTNGKVERFWRTLNDDLIEGTTFDSKEHFQDELRQYLFYYNRRRPHQGLAGETPESFLNKNCQRIT